MNIDNMSIVIMGISGSGKTTVGTELARRLGRPFVDADDLHDADSKAKMAGGLPLDDVDRWPWLDRVGASLSRQPRPVVACSALRRIYRDRLRVTTPSLVFVHLEVDEPRAAQRMLRRHHEFMPASLLASQLATLEPLQPDEPGISMHGSASVEQLAKEVERALGSMSS